MSERSFVRSREMRRRSRAAWSTRFGFSTRLPSTPRASATPSERSVKENLVTAWFGAPGEVCSRAAVARARARSLRSERLLLRRCVVVGSLRASHGAVITAGAMVGWWEGGGGFGSGGAAARRASGSCSCVSCRAACARPVVCVHSRCPLAASAAQIHASARICHCVAGASRPSAAAGVTNMRPQGTVSAGAGARSLVFSFGRTAVGTPAGGNAVSARHPARLWRGTAQGAVHFSMQRCAAVFSGICSTGATAGGVSHRPSVVHLMFASPGARQQSSAAPGGICTRMDSTTMATIMAFTSARPTCDIQNLRAS